MEAMNIMADTQPNNEKKEETRAHSGGRPKQKGYDGYVNNSLWNNPPENFDDLLKDPRFKRLTPIARDAAAAKFLKMTYGEFQSYKYRNNIRWL